MWQAPGRAPQAGLLGFQSGQEMLQSDPGSRAVAGVAARGGVIAGGRHSSKSGTASWSAPTKGSLGSKTDVEAGADSAS